MKDYLYDGTFEGILTCVYHHYYTEPAAGIYSQGEYQPNLLHAFAEVKTEPDKATRVYDAINKKISAYCLRNIYRAYLSCVPGKENAILKYVVLGFKKGPQIRYLHGNAIVYELESIVKKVGVEQERMLQFVRFEVMTTAEPIETAKAAAGAREILYACIEPDHDVLELVAHHFAERFKHDPLIIHDVNRNKAIIAYEGKWYSTPFGEHEGDAYLMSADKMVQSQREKEYQCLWRMYFENIAIKQRTNPRCQRNFMPARYWKHLTEML